MWGSTHSTCQLSDSSLNKQNPIARPMVMCDLEQTYFLPLCSQLLCLSQASGFISNVQSYRFIILSGMAVHISKYSMLLSSGRCSVITRRLLFPHKDCFFAMPVFFWSQTRKWCPLSILRVSRSVSLSNHSDEFISMKKCVVKGFTLPAMRCVYTYKHAQCTQYVPLSLSLQNFFHKEFAFA